MSTVPALEVTSGGRWRITFLPRNWEFLAGYGIRHASPGNPPSIALTEDTLPVGDKLEPYIQAQITIMKRNLSGIVTVGPQAAPWSGTDESMLLFLKYPSAQGEGFAQMQQYARVAKWIGIVTLTAPESLLGRAKEDFQAFVRGLRVQVP